jgi:hypothetical protein
MLILQYGANGQDFIGKIFLQSPPSIALSVIHIHDIREVDYIVSPRLGV